MRDLKTVTGRKPQVEVKSGEQSSPEKKQSDMNMDPFYMQKIIGNRAVQYLVEAQLLAGAQLRAADQDIKIPAVDYNKEEKKIGEDREALKEQILREMKEKKSSLHLLMDKNPGEPVYINVMTDLSFVIVESNIEANAFYDKMALLDVSYSLDNKEYTAAARQEQQGTMQARQVFSFEFDEEEYADLMPEQHIPVVETIAVGAVTEATIQDEDGVDTDDVAAGEIENKTDSIIEEVVEEGKKKFF